MSMPAFTDEQVQRYSRQIILGELWSKMLMNSVTVLGALAGLLTGELLVPEPNKRVVIAVLREGIAESGYRLVINMGRYLHIFHLHIHVLCGHRLGPEG